jgi:hypothetical protein
MTRNINATAQSWLSARLVASLAISGILTAGAFVGSASAQRQDDHRGGWAHRDDRGRGNWGGGYYAAPPVVYAAPAYPPPVVYAPGIAVGLPGINVIVR